VQTEPHQTARPERGPHSHVAPLRLLDLEWLKGWSAKLDPRRHPSVSGAEAVAWLLRSVEPAPPVIREQLRLPRLVTSD
jgi:hypothetical protein